MGLKSPSVVLQHDALKVLTLPLLCMQLAMHSIREMCSVDDCSHAYQHFMSFMEDFTALEASIDVDSLEDADIQGAISDVPCNHL